MVGVGVGGFGLGLEVDLTYRLGQEAPIYSIAPGQPPSVLVGAQPQRETRRKRPDLPPGLPSSCLDLTPPRSPLVLPAPLSVQYITGDYSRN